MDQPVHILTKLGILKSFSIAKKITEEEIIKFFNRYKKIGKTEEEIGELLKTKIFEEIRYAIETKKIPGVILPDNSPLTKKILVNLTELNKLMYLTKSALLKKKYDKMSLCYFINSLVNLLGLTEKDFESFHKKMSNEEDTDDDDEPTE